MCCVSVIFVGCAWMCFVLCVHFVCIVCGVRVWGDAFCVMCDVYVMCVMHCVCLLYMLCVWFV